VGVAELARISVQPLRRQPQNTRKARKEKQSQAAKINDENILSLAFFRVFRVFRGLLSCERCGADVLAGHSARAAQALHRVP
jgi:hypothetical protein